MRFTLLLCALSITLSGCSAQPATTAPAQLSPEIQQRIDALFKDFNRNDSPGYAIGISKGGKTLYAQGYGAANLDYEIPITPQSAFSIASVSKQFTAACIALLILDGELSLETPVVKYVPALAKYPDTIRVKHLIYNTSGIRDYYHFDRPNGKSWITFNFFDVEECITTSLMADSLDFKPGERWNYCNVNFMLLTKIVASISGQSFASFAQDRLFTPLGMNNTHINDDATAIIKNRVTPYNERTAENVAYYGEAGVTIGPEGEYLQHPRVSPHYGGSGVVTTVEDLLKWCGNMLSHEFGGQALYDLMHRTETFAHDRTNQAFGLYHGDFNGHPIVAWDGGDWGISAQMIRFPEQEVAIIVLSNLGSGESYRKANQIGDILSDAGLL